ncbi:Serine/threonine-protein kinase Nek3 [Myotis davidii]|uniref:Serine/threonine-protein kinase Nek3 n=1 Tax=Myotis davidii TaxID=225400 RepID=L5M685_MYODS|nr:Serine/threonine-protein kinase Nek3 [Myotis davidii]
MPMTEKRPPTHAQSVLMPVLILVRMGRSAQRECPQERLTLPQLRLPAVNPMSGTSDSSRIKIALEKEASTVQGEEQGRKCSHPDLESTNKNSVASAPRRVDREEKDGKSVHHRKAGSPSPLRRQWEKHVCTTALAALENASILASSLTTEDDRGSEGFCLKGPLSEETEASDSVDGGYDSVILDPERLEPRLDEEDTDFEEEDNNFDWVSELKQRAGWHGASGD